MAEQTIMDRIGSMRLPEWLENQVSKNTGYRADAAGRLTDWIAGVSPLSEAERNMPASKRWQVEQQRKTQWFRRMHQATGVTRAEDKEMTPENARWLHARSRKQQQVGALADYIRTTPVGQAAPQTYLPQNLRTPAEVARAAEIAGKTPSAPANYLSPSRKLDRGGIPGVPTLFNELPASARSGLEAMSRGLGYASEQVQRGRMKGNLDTAAEAARRAQQQQQPYIPGLSVSDHMKLHDAYQQSPGAKAAAESRARVSKQMQDEAAERARPGNEALAHARASLQARMPGPDWRRDRPSSFTKDKTDDEIRKQMRMEGRYTWQARPDEAYQLTDPRHRQAVDYNNRGMYARMRQKLRYALPPELAETYTGPQMSAQQPHGTYKNPQRGPHPSPYQGSPYNWPR